MVTVEVEVIFVPDAVASDACAEVVLLWWGDMAFGFFRVGECGGEGEQEGEDLEHHLHRE